MSANRFAPTLTSDEQGTHEAHRSPSPHQEPRDGRRGGHVRPPRRRDPARLRPAHRLVDPPHPRAPRAGRRPHGGGLRARDRPARRRDGHERSRRRRTSSRRSCDAYMDSVPIVVHHRPGAVRGDRHRRVPGGDTVGITMPITKHNWLDHRRAGHPARRPRGVPRRDDGPARPGARRLPEGRRQPDDGVVLAREGRPARLQAEREGSPEADQGRGAAHRRGAPAGDLRGRRHPQGGRVGAAARARRAHRHSRSSRR